MFLLFLVGAAGCHASLFAFPQQKNNSCKFVVEKMFLLFLVGAARRHASLFAFPQQKNNSCKFALIRSQKNKTKTKTKTKSKTKTKTKTKTETELEKFHHSTFTFQHLIKNSRKFVVETWRVPFPRSRVPANCQLSILNYQFIIVLLCNHNHSQIFHMTL